MAVASYPPSLVKIEATGAEGENKATPWLGNVPSQSLTIAVTSTVNVCTCVVVLSNVKVMAEDPTDGFVGSFTVDSSQVDVIGANDTCMEGALV